MNEFYKNFTVQHRVSPWTRNQPINLMIFIESVLSFLNFHFSKFHLKYTNGWRVFPHPGIFNTIIPHRDY